ncbi:MAG: hypothetical protein DRJ26_00035 [Candidatus Methanomethylicota archaeon]|uniref:4Fe-4S ferredoxin n=1 Tax=Thermoproteota archaeon TaxID=2056631 RepID=A0A497F8E8_9CREN|nr:MAG: hypothetical protein DRJ26_00035 [Candidatus Verstraetearchaeota archaeon]
MSELLSTSVKSKMLRGASLLIYSKCIEQEYPGILREFSDGRVALGVCMELLHMNMVGFKLLNIVKLSNVKELEILTMDGSPHCIQLHFIGEHINRALGEPIPLTHYVIEKGKVFKVSTKVIKLARHLSECAKLLGGDGENA